MKKAFDGAARLAVGDQAYQEGDIRVASRMFMSVANSRPATPVNEMARQRLSQLSDEALKKINAVENQLAEKAAQFSPSEKMGVNDLMPREWKLAVTTAFTELEVLQETYDSVPLVRGELKTRLAKARRRPEHAAVLNEAEAAALCEIARQHERDQQQCCAYWVYKEAAKLDPAPSARTAAEQVARMDQDPQLVAAAEKCRQLKECHKLYNRAESVVATWPARARELLTRILDTAPSDSEIYRAARERISKISDG